jgi:hypothetical protein
MRVSVSYQVVKGKGITGKVTENGRRMSDARVGLIG